MLATFFILPIVIAWIMIVAGVMMSPETLRQAVTRNALVLGGLIIVLAYGMTIIHV